MDEATGIAIVKIISMISTAAFAILGTLTEFKREGRITFWGRVSIVGVLLSATLSGITFGFEQRKNLKDSQAANAEREKLQNSLRTLTENADKSLHQIDGLFSESRDISKGVKENLSGQEQVLSQSQEISTNMSSSLLQQGSILDQVKGQVILQGKTYKKAKELQDQQGLIADDMHRSLTPLSPLRIRYLLKLPFSRKEVKDYADHLKDMAKDNNNFSSTFLPGIVYEKGEISEIFFTSDSDTVFPLGENERQRTLSSILNQNRMSMSFIKGLEKETKIRSFFVLEDPDLEIEAYAWSSNTVMQEDVKQWDVVPRETSQAVKVTIVFLETNKWPLDHPGIYLDIATDIFTRRNRTNKVVSLADLPDSLFTVTLPCGSELMNFEFHVGTNYERSYYLQGEGFKTLLEDKPDSDYSCQYMKYYPLTLKEFPFYWGVAQK